MDGLTTGQLARLGAVGIPTVRYYERSGILPKPRRSRGGYRLYDAAAVARIRFIKRAQILGFTLREIEELLALRLDSSANCAKVRERAQEKLMDVNDKIRQLRTIKNAIGKLIENCNNREPGGECPLLDTIQGHSNSGSQQRSQYATQRIPKR